MLLISLVHWIQGLTSLTLVCGSVCGVSVEAASRVWNRQEYVGPMAPRFQNPGVHGGGRRGRPARSGLSLVLFIYFYFFNSPFFSFFFYFFPVFLLRSFFFLIYFIFHSFFLISFNFVSFSSFRFYFYFYFVSFPFLFF